MRVRASSTQGPQDIHRALRAAARASQESNARDNLANITTKDGFVLGNELASSIIFAAKSTLKKRDLARYCIVSATVIKDSHWRLIYIDNHNMTFSYLDPYGATEQEHKQAFDNWLKFVQTRKDLLLLHKDQPYTERVIKHPIQTDSISCGVYVCAFGKYLYAGSSIDCDDSNIRTLRREILNP